jgi:hypothetical protein
VDAPPPVLGGVVKGDRVPLGELSLERRGLQDLDDAT